MATYVQITQEEMEQVCSTENGFQLIQLPKTVELVYGKRVDRDGMPLSLRVYSSIDPNGKGRDRGKDAIRVEVYYRTK